MRSRYCGHLSWRDPDGDGGPFYDVEIRTYGVLVTRTRRRYVTVDDVEPSFRELDEALADVDPSTMGLLVDLRAIVGRNDPEFETELAPYRRRLLSRFARAGLVVRTTIGRLQLERYLAADGISAKVFDDPDAAMRWLDGD